MNPINIYLELLLQIPDTRILTIAKCWRGFEEDMYQVSIRDLETNDVLVVIYRDTIEAALKILVEILAKKAILDLSPVERYQSKKKDAPE